MNTPIVNQYKVTLMTSDQVKTQLVNCANSLSAQYICEGIYPNMRVIDVKPIRVTPILTPKL